MSKRYNEEDEEFNIFFLVNEYADSNPNFKNKFLNDVSKYYYQNGSISSDQFYVIKEIYSQIRQDPTKQDMKFSIQQWYDIQAKYNPEILKEAEKITLDNCNLKSAGAKKTYFLKVCENLKQE